MKPVTRREVVASIAALPVYAAARTAAGSVRSNIPRNSVVETKNGPVRGALDGDVTVFRGIPFAASPVGKNRFRAPLPHPKWSNIRDATEFGPICPQNTSRLARVMGDITLPQGEDNCLTLNIWTPSTKGAKAPVLLWIHGGGDTGGSGALGWYSGLQFARNGGIVVVTINYRLGPFGFIYLPGVADANIAFQDQQAALRWVNENIERFGGDPNNITVAGQSSGGRAVVMLAADDQTNRLFRRGIMQSPALAGPPLTPDEATIRTRDYVSLLKLDQPADIIKLPTDVLLAAHSEWVNAIRGHVYDGEVLRGDSVTALINGEGEHIELLVGTNREDGGTLYVFDENVRNASDAEIRRRFEGVFGDSADQYLDEYRRLSPHATPWRILGGLRGDASYLISSLDIVEARSRAGRPSYLYRFDWQSPNSLFGANHCLELPFVFNNFDKWRDSPMIAGGDQEEMNALAQIIHAAWSQFIKTGNPNHPNVPPWATYDLADRTTMRFDTVVEPVGDLAGRRWRNPWPKRELAV